MAPAGNSVSENGHIEAIDMVVSGIVQGVGFRPFVYREACARTVTGWVNNAVDGVHIHAEGNADSLDALTLAVAEGGPVAAQVTEVSIEEAEVQGYTEFEIRFSSDEDTRQPTLVSPDLATCDACVDELFDPANRRYHYPFINCTDCGPRFTIIRALPYDRPNTSMSAFDMCPSCAAEYANPADRRFHAQPDACWQCGPKLCEVVLDTPGQSGAAIMEQATWGETPEESDVLIARVADVLRAGGIAAIKGLGGYHLACDASNETALQLLRQRKRRPGKAFAIMAADIPTARMWACISEDEERLLRSPARPIVLLRKKPQVHYAAGLADGLPDIGIMLPSTPVQHLLLAAFKGVLVMTSGNMHDDPICMTDAEAAETLSGVADILLGNNRDILSRYDDSVVRIVNAAGEAAVQVIRRARGYVPVPLDVGAVLETDRTKDATEPRDASNDATQSNSQASDDTNNAKAQIAQSTPTIFATGPEQKNTFCFLRGTDAFVGQHIGDMESAATNDAWLQAKALFQQMMRLNPLTVACDMHPEYLTTKWAQAQDLPVQQVQHHHAHIVSAMAENGLRGPVCGIAFDGTGFGPDGAIWGGEVLLANTRTYERFANMVYIPLPGGAAAIKDPLRITYGALWAFDLLDHPAAAAALAEMGPTAEACATMIDRGLNCPFAGSVGRLFDAAGALLGVCRHPSYEGEVAILLEAAALRDNAPFDAHEAYAFSAVKNTATETSTALDTSVVLFDATPVFAALLDDIQQGVSVERIARRFHAAFVDVVVTAAQMVRMTYDISTVVLSGGVFMNRLLLEGATEALISRGFTIALNRELPPNDGCISLGQAVVARAIQ